MSNWYKQAYRGNIALMDQDEKERRSTDISIVEPFLGSNDRETSDGKGYPKGISSDDDYSDDKSGRQGYNKLPTDRTMLDDEITEDLGQGEGANDERFTDDIDKAPKEAPEPVGPFNMQRGGIFDQVAKKTRMRSLNRV
jgi:hypothetical protein